MICYSEQSLLSLKAKPMVNRSGCAYFEDARKAP